MSYNPGVGFFISFYNLDPSRDTQCIFFTQTGTRCKWDCSKADKERAVELRAIIVATANLNVRLDNLQEYIRCSCCRSGRARHRDRIEDIGLLIPLAERWRTEIQSRAAPRGHVPQSPQRNINYNAYNTPTTPRSDVSTPRSVSVSTPPYHHTSTPPYHYMPTPPYHHTPPPLPPPALHHTSTTSYHQASTPPYNHMPTSSYHHISTHSYHQGAASKPSSTNESPSIRSFQPNQRKDTPPTASRLIEYNSDPLESQQRYNLRPRGTATSINSSPTQLISNPKSPLSEFRPHIQDPLPSDSVSWKILEPLVDRDFETGSLYVFDRASSPDHVKIGWTARSVEDRLRGWSDCGYTPNLLFKVTGIPHAQRVETLTHHELLKEWRRERMCKASWCRKSHQEWFEVSRKRATAVLGDWALFMTKAKPYDSKGCLKGEWKVFVESTEKKGEILTINTLLDRYQEMLIEDFKREQERLSQLLAPHVKEEEATTATLKKDPTVILRKTTPTSEIPHQQIIQSPNPPALNTRPIGPTSSPTRQTQDVSSGSKKPTDVEAKEGSKSSASTTDTPSNSDRKSVGAPSVPGPGPLLSSKQESREVSAAPTTKSDPATECASIMVKREEVEGTNETSSIVQYQEEVTDDSAVKGLSLSRKLKARLWKKKTR